MTSPDDSMPAETSPRLPLTMPVPSLRTTSTAAAAIEASAVRDWPAPYARLCSPRNVSVSSAAIASG